MSEIKNSGIRYIIWNKKNGNWNVRVPINNKMIFLGAFDDLEDAKSELMKNKIPITSNKQGRKYSLDVDYFKNISSPEKAFWLGFICADGGLWDNRGTLVFRICQKEKDLLYKFKEDILFTGNVNYITNISESRYSDKPFYQIDINNKYFVKNLLDSGKTRYKKDLDCIPKSVPEEYIVDFIRGYFEGDGTIYFDNNNKNWISAISGFSGLLEDIQKYLGFGNIQKDKSIYRLNFGGNLITKRFIDLIYYDDSLYGIKHLKYLKERDNINVKNSNMD